MFRRYFRHVERDTNAIARRRLSQRDKEFNIPRSVLYDEVLDRHKFDLDIKRSIVPALEPRKIVNREIVRRQRGQEHGRPSNTDRRAYHPERGYVGSDVYGKPARVEMGVRGKPAYVSLAAFPCVQRSIRREVMFAKRKAGKGYKKRKRRTDNSDTEC